MDPLSRQRGNSIDVAAVGVPVCGTAGCGSSHRVCPVTCVAIAASGVCSVGYSVKRDLLQCQKRPVSALVAA